MARGLAGHGRLVLARLNTIRSCPGDGRRNRLRPAGLDVRDSLSGAAVAIAVGSDRLGNKNECLGLADCVDNGYNSVVNMAPESDKSASLQLTLCARCRCNAEDNCGRSL